METTPPVSLKIQETVCKAPHSGMVENRQSENGNSLLNICTHPIPAGALSLNVRTHPTLFWVGIGGRGKGATEWDPSIMLPSSQFLKPVKKFNQSEMRVRYHKNTSNPTVTELHTEKHSNQ